jgi:hypothetical protein
MPIKKILKIRKELDKIAEEDFEATERIMAQNPNYEEIVALRKKSESFWEKKEYENALAILEDACSLEPLLKDELSSLKSYYSHKKKVGRVNFNKSIKKFIFPKTEKYGFIFNEQMSSRGAFYFTRKKNKKREMITMGREKFGHLFEIAAFKIEGLQGEICLPFNFTDHNIETNRFPYVNQSELDQQLQTVVELIEHQIIPWFEK